MRDVYDHPEDAFAEQSQKLPRGAMGLREPPQVLFTDGIPADAAEL